MKARDEDSKVLQPNDGVLGGLESLREQIDAASYPGRTWTPPRRIRRFIFAAGAVGSAAAAVVLLALALHQPAKPVAPLSHDVAQLPTAPVAAGKTATHTIEMSTQMNLSFNGGLALDIPSADVPPVNRITVPVSLTSEMPSFSLPTIEWP